MKEFLQFIGAGALFIVGFILIILLPEKIFSNEAKSIIGFVWVWVWIIAIIVKS